MKKATTMIYPYIVLYGLLLALVAGKRTTSRLDLSSSLLPEEYPDGDVSSYALPVFIQEPENAYTSKGKPGIIECRVAHARRAYFVCKNSTRGSSLADYRINNEYRT